MQALRLPSTLGVGAPPVRKARCVIVRADPPRSGARVTREFREGDSEVSVPGASTPRQQADGLYVDADAAMRQPKKSNLSKEMKARLRAEYTGLGGAENKDDLFPATPLAMPSPRAPLIIAAASVATAPPSPSTITSSASAEDYESLQRHPGATVRGVEAFTSASVAPASTATTSAAADGKLGASKWVIDESENLKSTPEMRAWTWVSISLCAATLQQATMQVKSGEDVVVFGAAVLLAYILADLGTGIYHWGVDNYGDGSTPVFGRQIAAFQGHHQRPWTITQREFANNMHQVFGPASYPAAMLLVASPLMSLGWNAWSSSFLFLVCMSQQFHAWSHMKKSELPGPVVMLQDAGLLIGRRQHGAHHRPPFDNNYCIVSGWWNSLLDSTGFFRRLEKEIHNTTGVAPRCWDDPEEWHEMDPQGAPQSSSA